jgi:hypothetical protein
MGNDQIGPIQPDQVVVGKVHGAAIFSLRAFGHHSGLGKSPLRLGHRLEDPECRTVGLEARQGSFKQRQSEIMFQRLDVAADRGLADAQLARGSRQRAVSHNGCEAAPQRPVGFLIHS